MSKKITYIGPFWDSTGYCDAASKTTLCIQKAGYAIQAKTVKLTGQKVDAYPDIQKLELIRHKPDVVIQNYLPPLMVYHAGAKNIGYFFCETSHFRPSNWQYNLNLMDEVWVCCDDNVEAAKRSGVTKPIKKVPIPYVNPYSSVVDRMDFGLPEDTFVFFNVGDFSYRKNIMGLVEAYFLSFTKYDNVALILKCYCDGQPTQKSVEIIKHEINNLKKQLKKHNVDIYPPVYLVADYLDEVELQKFHNVGDCFISLERGAAWNLPCYQAMGEGKPVIVSGGGGQTEYLTGEKEGVTLLDGEIEFVKNMAQCPYPGLYTCHEKWFNPSIQHTVFAMQHAYRQGKVRYDRSTWLSKWNLEGCAAKFKEVLS